LTRNAAVLGAGPGGLAGAIALAQAAMAVTVFERAPQLEEVGAGLQLSPNACHALEAIGARAAIEAVAIAPPQAQLRSGRDDRLIFANPLGDIAIARYGAPYLHLHRADLQHVLAQRAQAAGADLRLGVAVARVGPDGGVQLETGEALVFDLVLAADGVRSSVRQHWFDGAAPRFTGQAAWRALVPRELAQPSPAGVTVWAGPQRHLVAYDLGPNRGLNLVAVTERSAWVEPDWRQRGDPQELRAAFADFPAAARRLLEPVADCQFWGLFDHAPLPHWVRGKIALLGDSAHPMLPFLAQGAAMAIEDAAILGLCLQADPEIETALARYQRQRRPRTARVQAVSRANAKLFHAAGLRASLQHGAIALVNHMAPGLGQARLDWVYGWRPALD